MAKTKEEAAKEYAINLTNPDNLLDDDSVYTPATVYMASEMAFIAGADWQASTSPCDELRWVNEKPVFKEDCLLMAKTKEEALEEIQNLIASIQTDSGKRLVSDEDCEYIANKVYLIAASQQSGARWVKDKPVFKEECVFISATLFKDKWEYRLWQIIWDDDYFALCDGEGDVWGDIADLRADKYMIIHPDESPSPCDELREAASELLHLHLCEQEGLLSGQPTYEQWINAVDKLSKIIHP